MKPKKLGNDWLFIQLDHEVDSEDDGFSEFLVEKYDFSFKFRARIIGNLVEVIDGGSTVNDGARKEQLSGFLFYLLEIEHDYILSLVKDNWEAHKDELERLDSTDRQFRDSHYRWSTTRSLNNA